MKFSIGIVGLPNVGKSTLFKALTKKKVDASNYPFCTIDPNVGVVTVPDDRLEQLAKIYKSEKIVPTIIEFVDIAGLVKDAHKGEGLGNQFLSHIREVDAICQVVRGFKDSDVTHVAGQINPDEDKKTINLELIFADLQTVAKRLAETVPKARSGDKEARELLRIYEKIQKLLDQGTLLSQVSWQEEELNVVKELCLLTIKPILYVLNVDESEAAHKVPGYVVISAKIESELAEMSTQEAGEYLQSLGLSNTGLDKLIKESYKLLNLITFFTAGPKETHAWTLVKGSSAPQAGGVVHSDFEEKFIRAEVAAWSDIVKYGGEAGARAKGKIRIEGREYLIKDGDVVYFRI